jgi:hypothetical protein
VNCQYLIPMQCDFNKKTMLLGSLSVETISYLSWRRDMCLATFVSLKIDVERVLIDPLSFIC